MRYLKLIKKVRCNGSEKKCMVTGSYGHEKKIDRGFEHCLIYLRI